MSIESLLVSALLVGFVSGIVGGTLVVLCIMLRKAKL